MRLHRVTSIHYGPKSHHEAVEAYLIADDEEQVIVWVSKANSDHWDPKWNDMRQQASVSPSREWWEKNPGARDRAGALGLTIDEYDTVNGPEGGVLRFWRGDFRDPEDLYYGATQFWWDEGVEIAEADAAVLLRVGVAKDARGAPIDTDRFEMLDLFQR